MPYSGPRRHHRHGIFPGWIWAGTARDTRANRHTHAPETTVSSSSDQIPKVTQGGFLISLSFTEFISITLSRTTQGSSFRLQIFADNDQETMKCFRSGQRVMFLKLKIDLLFNYVTYSGLLYGFPEK